ncbi:MAG: hypothetical protein H0T18_06635 [Chloroflexia bacterium]|nr:hypothetical protein [Chloroflexia bacterium]
MDMLRRLFGGDEPRRQPTRTMPRSRQMSPDEQAVDRYRYLLRTAPPETIEEAHAEAFAKLTPEQRRMVLQELDSTLTPAERASGVAYDEDPRSLARLATRAEVRQPGTLERTWSGMPAMGGMGMGGLMMNSFMGTIAGVFVGSMIADAFLGNSGYDQGSADGTGDASAEGGDFADSGDAGAGDSGGFGDFGGDAGGFGDFGGGDFGGGDF